MGRHRKLVATLICLAVAASVPLSTTWGRGYRLTEERWLVLEIRPLAVEDGETKSFGSHTLEIPPSRSGSLEISLPWPDAGRPGKLRLAARGTPGAEGSVHAVSLESSWKPGGGQAFRAERSFTLEEGATKFVEILAREGLHLTLAVRAEAVTRPVLEKPQAGRPVRILLAVEKVLEGRSVLLETNELSTLVGERVEYSFRRGDGDTLERLRLGLRPVSVTGEILKMEVIFEGTLHDLDSPLYLSRSEELLTTRDAVSVFEASSGDPPSGYRFRITPSF